MKPDVKPGLKKMALMMSAMALSLFGSPVVASGVDSARLLELMVQKGLVTREEADGLIAEAAASPQGQAQAPVPAGGVHNGVQTIPYIPQVVRDEIKAEVKAELGQQAQVQGWSRPGETPEWTKRITLTGDIRARANGLFFDEGNGDIFANYSAINAGSGQNINDDTPGFVGPEFINTREDRTQFQVRARFGVQLDIADWISAELRVATGNDSSPVSTNQTLGNGAELGKYQLWLDRAAIRLSPVDNVAIDLGRFGNPFRTSELLFDEDLNFDGVAVSGTHAVQGVGRGLGLFGTVGAFPLYNTGLNVGTLNAPKGEARHFASKDKYLYAAQIGADYAVSERLKLKGAVGYFAFEGVSGQVSSPCYFYEVVCDTDMTRPGFQQHGNTVFPIRNVIFDTSLNPAVEAETQYFGLASDFEVLNVRAEAELSLEGNRKLRIEGDYVKNLGFDRTLVAARAVNTLGPSTFVPDPADTTKEIEVPGAYAGGDEGWSLKATVGHLSLRQRGDWNAHVGYRHLESDAVVDGFADSDFGIGGTNVKGWFVGGNYGLSERSYVGVRWLSAEEIADAPFSVDRLLIDLGVRF